MVKVTVPEVVVACDSVTPAVLSMVRFAVKLAGKPVPVD